MVNNKSIMKKIIAFLLSIVFLLPLSFTLTACHDSRTANSLPIHYLTGSWYGENESERWVFTDNGVFKFYHLDDMVYHGTTISGGLKGVQHWKIENDILILWNSYLQWVGYEHGYSQEFEIVNISATSFTIMTPTFDDRGFEPFTYFRSDFVSTSTACPHFAPDSILVMLDNETSLNIARHQTQIGIEFFTAAGFDFVDAVAHMTFIEEELVRQQLLGQLDEREGLFNLPMFRVQLYIKLTEPSRDNVLAAVEAITAHAQVYSSMPNWFGNIWL